MRTSSAISMAGAVLTAFGTLFYLQGLAVVGPESSFMYHNPNWESYGVWIATAGALMFLAGVISRFARH